MQEFEYAYEISDLLSPSTKAKFSKKKNVWISLESRSLPEKFLTYSKSNQKHGQFLNDITLKE